MIFILCEIIKEEISLNLLDWIVRKYVKMLLKLLKIYVLKSPMIFNEFKLHKVLIVSINIFQFEIIDLI